MVTLSLRFTIIINARHVYVTANSPMWLGPLMQDVAWNPIKDFAPLMATMKAEMTQFGKVMKEAGLREK